jgi:hypothetical protein
MSELPPRRALEPVCTHRPGVFVARRKSNMATAIGTRIRTTKVSIDGQCARDRERDDAWLATGGRSAQSGEDYPGALNRRAFRARTVLSTMCSSTTRSGVSCHQ